MSERGFQQALVHLFTNVDEYGCRDESALDRFALSDHEKGWLTELLTSQRDGLLLFQSQMQGKCRRLLLDSLTNACIAARERLDVLIDSFVSLPWTEGLSDPAAAVRPFARYVGEIIESGKDTSKETEFIWFEATCAATLLPLPTGATPRPRRLTPDARLSTNGDRALIRVRHDVVRVVGDPALLTALDRLLEPCWLFVFQGLDGDAKVLKVSDGMARAIKSLQRGSAVADVLRTLEDSAAKRAALDGMERLLSAGVPFFSPS